MWVDKVRTGPLTENGHGITVSLTHAGKNYPDDWSEDGVIYHYPETSRPKGRDASEIAATKNAGQLGLPVFVITHINHSRRKVLLGWVMNWDDRSKQFLILFDHALGTTATHTITTGAKQHTLVEREEHYYTAPGTDVIHENDPFILTQPEQGKQRLRSERAHQQRFKFAVFQRYSPACGVCGITIMALLQAAHIVPKEQHGSDDPRNGLVLCANHHLAFDTHLFVIHPEHFTLCYHPSGPTAAQLQIVHPDLHHLPRLPHKEALQWRYHRWKERH
jgi:hypothetical protein